MSQSEIIVHYHINSHRVYREMLLTRYINVRIRTLMDNDMYVSLRSTKRNSSGRRAKFDGFNGEPKLARTETIGRGPSS